MDKSKKRAISRGKFVRVMSTTVDVPYNNIDSFVSLLNPEVFVAAYINNGFIYWKEAPMELGSSESPKFFRKSVKEALS